MKLPDLQDRISGSLDRKTRSFENPLADRDALGEVLDGPFDCGEPELLLVAFQDDVSSHFSKLEVGENWIEEKN